MEPKVATPVGRPTADKKVETFHHSGAGLTLRGCGNFPYPRETFAGVVPALACSGNFPELAANDPGKGADLVAGLLWLNFVETFHQVGAGALPLFRRRPEREPARDDRGAAREYESGSRCKPTGRCWSNSITTNLDQRSG